MTASDIGSIASAVVALAALIVSVVSLRKTNKFGETADRLNRLLIERETADGAASKMADLSANMIHVGKNDHRLKVFNRGKGVARNVRLTDLNPSDSILIAGEIARKFPVPILEQHQWVEVIAANHMGAGPRVHIRLQWDDDAGAGHEKELTPTV
jgi:hypothetical protein